MASDEAIGGTGTSAVAPGLADTKHGSAAGSMLRTSGDAAQGASRHVSPLGIGTITNPVDDATPAGTRRQVSRDPPATPLGFMNQAALGDRSLGLSTNQCRTRPLNAGCTT